MFNFFKAREALKVNGKCPNALSMLGNLELKGDDWFKAKDTFRAAREATDGKDSYAAISLVRHARDVCTCKMCEIFMHLSVDGSWLFIFFN